MDNPSNTHFKHSNYIYVRMLNVDTPEKMRLLRPSSAWLSTLSSVSYVPRFSMYNILYLQVLDDFFLKGEKKPLLCKGPAQRDWILDKRVGPIKIYEQM